MRDTKTIEGWEDYLKALRDRSELLHENLATLMIRSRAHFDKGAARQSWRPAESISSHHSVFIPLDVAQQLRLTAFDNSVSVSSVVEVALHELFQRVNTNGWRRLLFQHGADHRRR